MRRVRVIIALILAGLAMSICRAEVVVTKTFPEKPYSLLQVAVDPASGMIAVFKQEHDKPEVAVYTTDGALRSRFRVAPVTFLAWLPGSKLFAPVTFPNRSQVPYLYSPDGETVGRFGTQWPLLQMFVHDGRWAGADVTPGGVLVDKDGNIYLSATWADDDFLKPEEIKPEAKARYDKGYGAKILVYAPNGALLRTIGDGWGKEPGRLMQPGVMAFNQDATLLAVQNKNGLDIFDVATGKQQARISGYRLVANGRAPIMVVEKAGRLYQLDFAGNEVKAYPPIDRPLNTGMVLADGTLFLPGGPGVTFFRKFSPEGKLLLANGEPFTALIAKLPDAQAKAGDTLAFSAQLLDAASYYRGNEAGGKLYAFGRSLIDAEDWRPLPLTVTDGKTNVTLPAGIAGPYQVRLANKAVPDAEITADFKLRVPGRGDGSVTAFTPRNRRAFQQGEVIRFHVVIRSRVPVNGELEATLSGDRQLSGISAHLPVTLTADEACTLNLAVPVASSRLLLPGEYTLDVRFGTLNSYPAHFTLVSAVPETISQRFFTWDSGFFPEDWDYPLTRGELIAWMGGNTLVKDMQFGNPLTAVSEQGDAGLLRGDPALPAPEFAFTPGGWQDFLDTGLKNGLGLMPEVQAGWEAYPVRRSDAMLADDARKVQLTAQSLGQYPNFRGLNYNGTNFFMQAFEKEYKDATGEEAPKKEDMQPLRDGKWNPDVAARMDRYLGFLTGIYAKDYRVWSAALRAVAPSAPRMATFTEAELAAWPPALAQYLDITQSYKQSEQILAPYQIAVQGSWNGIPGLPQASTFEGFNETGTGERLGAEVAQAMLTGSYPGVVSPVIGGEAGGDRSPNTKRGAPYVHQEFFRRYQLIGDLLTAARVASPVGLLLTRNQALAEYRLDRQYAGKDTLWLRHWSAYVLCQMAHRPARAIYGEYLAQGKGLDGLKVILLTGQTAPLTVGELQGLKAFQQKGGTVLLDAACTVDVPGAKRLACAVFSLEGFGFNAKYGGYQTDGTWQIIPEMLKAKLPQFSAELDKYLPAVYVPDSPDIFCTPFNGGAVTYLALVNTRRPPIPDLQYAKVAARFSSIMPLITRVKVPANTAAVYDVLAGKALPIQNGMVTVDLRSYANTVLALLPAAAPALQIKAPPAVKCGAQLTIAVQAVGKDGRSLAAAVPFLLEVKADNGAVLARRIGATENNGLFTLPLVAPFGAQALAVTAVCTAGGTTATGKVTITAGETPAITVQPLLAFRLQELAPAIKEAGSAIIIDDGDKAMNGAIDTLLTRLNIDHSTRRWGEIARTEEDPSRQVLIVTGGGLLDEFRTDRYGLLPVRVSDNVPGKGNGLLAFVFSPQHYRQDMLLALAGDEAGRAQVMAALEAALTGETRNTDVELVTARAPLVPGAIAGAGANTIADTLAALRKPAVARIGSLALSMDGKTLYAGGLNWDTNLYAIDTATGAVKWATHAGQGYVRQVWALGNNGVAARTLTSDDAGHQVEIFDAAGKPLRRFAAPGVHMMPNGEYMAFWGEPYGWAFDVSPDGKVLAASGNIAVAAWEIDTGKQLWVKEHRQEITEFTVQPARRLAISPDGRQIAIVSCVDKIYSPPRYTARIEVCDLRTGEARWSYTPEPFDQVNAVTPVWSGDSKRVVFGHHNAAWELEGGKVTRSFTAWPGEYRPGTYELFDGKTLLGEDGATRWRLATRGRAMSFAWSPDGNMVGISTDLGEFELHGADGKLLDHRSTNGAAALAVDNGNRIFLGDWAGALTIVTPGDEASNRWRRDLGEARLAAPLLPDSAYAAPPKVELVSYWPKLQVDAAPQGENLALTERGAAIKLCGKGGWGFRGRVEIDPALLINGKTDDLPRSWLDLDEVWTSLTFNTPPTAEITLKQESKVTGLVIHESAAHPEAFPRIVFIDALVNNQWTRVWTGLVDPALTHNHTFKEPVTARALRYTIAACALNGVYTSEIEVRGTQ